MCNTIELYKDYNIYFVNYLMKNIDYIDAYNREVALHPDAKKISVKDKTCLCTHMRNYDCWTCGQYTYRLKDTSRRNADGSYQILSAEHVFKDYQFSTGNTIALPATLL